MRTAFVSEAIVPLDGSFDAAGMATGGPGLPRRFRWRRDVLEVAEVLESWKEYGDCTHGSGERYVRKHAFRVRTTDGRVLRLYFQRHFGKRQTSRARWWIQSVEA
jgi:phosphoribosylglycinamide formyltransferase-1